MQVITIYSDKFLVECGKSKTGHFGHIIEDYIQEKLYIYLLPYDKGITITTSQLLVVLLLLSA